jgi:hypothetical protein
VHRGRRLPRRHPQTRRRLNGHVSPLARQWTVREVAERPERSLVTALREFATTQIADCGGPVAIVGPPLRHLAGGGQLCGPAVTVWTKPGDILYVLKATDLIAAGDVLVVDGGSRPDAAVIGDIAGQALADLGCDGLVVDGAVRDLDGLERSPIRHRITDVDVDPPLEGLAHHIPLPPDCSKPAPGRTSDINRGLGLHEPQPLSLTDSCEVTRQLPAQERERPQLRRASRASSGEASPLASDPGSASTRPAICRAARKYGNVTGRPHAAAALTPAADKSGGAG